MHIDRRRVLIVLGAITPCVFGCIAPPAGQSLGGVDDPRDPDDEDGGAVDQEAGASDDAAPSNPDQPGADAGAVDSGGPSAVDGGGVADTGGGGGTATCPTTLVDAGSVASLPANKWIKVSATKPFILGHDSGGFYAFSAKCTHHSSVTIGSPDASGATVCPSHGARFDSNGNVTRGPATTSLKHYAVTVCNGRIYVDPNTTVAASTRV